MISLIYNSNDITPIDYEERKTAKAVVIDDQLNVYTLGQFLLGGGVEEGETYEEALHRELMEEGGMEVEILRPLGEVVAAYRDALKRMYVTKGFLCKVIRKVSAPTTKEPYELEEELKVRTKDETIESFEKEIEELMENKENVSSDEYQSTLYHKQMILAFLKEAFK